MSDDLPNSEVVDRFHNDLLVKRLPGSDNAGVSNDVEKGVAVGEVPKIAFGRVFLQAR
jgi:hypothetical protein